MKILLVALMLTMSPLHALAGDGKATLLIYSMTVSASLAKTIEFADMRSCEAAQKRFEASKADIPVHQYMHSVCMSYRSN